MTSSSNTNSLRVIKISFITSAYYPAVVYGGPIFSIKNLAESISLKHIVRISSANPNGKTRLPDPVNTWIQVSPNLLIKFYKETVIGRFSLPMMLNVWKDIKQVDVVHSHDILSTTNVWAILYSLLYRKPLMLSVRGKLSGWSLEQKSFGKKLWFLLTVKPFIKRLYFHATSHQERDHVVKYFPKAKGVFVIPNPLPELSSKENVFTAARASSDNMYSHKIISLGRLHKVKGFDILIRSFKIVLNTFPTSQLIIAGNDEGEKVNLERLVSELKCGDNIIIRGPLYGEEKNSFYSAADVFALPSHTENFGMVYAEALAAGTPIVASTNTPWEEAALAGCGSWVANTPEKFAEAINLILANGREFYSDKCQSFANRFRPGVVAAQMINAYTTMLEGHKIGNEVG